MASFRILANFAVKRSPQLASMSSRSMSTQMTHNISSESTRMFSTEGSRVATKVHNIFEEYRMQNYTQCIPSRFRKEIVNAADKDKKGYITTEEFESILRNIGADGRITREEINTIVKEAGEEKDGSTTAISVDRMMLLI
uniref:EF-hand domain-containing protein n=1 Tax=Ditylum brightwellii TaxID=49249 RepID=A0A7S2EID8_9STRA